jgi:hypothetical protein
MKKKLLTALIFLGLLLVEELALYKVSSPLFPTIRCLQPPTNTWLVFLQKTSARKPVFRERWS